MPTDVGEWEVSTQSVSVVVATFGDSAWPRLAWERAIPSVLAQVPLPELVYVHGQSLAEARNGGACAATGPLLCFLDADDELRPGYVAAMAAAKGDLLQPATVTAGSSAQPACAELTDLRRNNCFVIGTGIRRELFWKAGGFYDEPCMEDLSLWLRCMQNRPTVVQVPDAIYTVYNSTNSRNHDPRRFNITMELVRKYGRY